MAVLNDAGLDYYLIVHGRARVVEGTTERVGGVGPWAGRPEAAGVIGAGTVDPCTARAAC